MEQLPIFPSFDSESNKESSGPRWQKWVERLENLFVGLKIDDEKRQRALLLHYAGEQVYDIYDANKGATEETFEATKKVLNDYFAPKKNVQIEIFKFRSCKQKDSQSLDEYVTELRQVAKSCAFGDSHDKELLSQLIQCCKSTRLRRRALREANKSLDDILTMGRALEMADSQAAFMERDTEREIVNKVKSHAKSSKKYGGQLRPRDKDPKKKPPRTCRYCGGEYPHPDNKCPAFGKTCNFCKKKNHFKSVCRKFNQQAQSNSKVSQVSELSDTSDDEYCYSVEIIGKIGNTPKTEIKVNEVSCKLLIDTGASVNILDEQTYKAIGSPKLHRKSEPKLMPYGGNKPLKVKGECNVPVETKSKFSCQKFYVVPGNHGSLLGYETAKELNLVKIVNTITKPQDKYTELFKGIGKLKSQKVKLHINENVIPVAIQNRRTPFHLRDKVEKELNKLLADDIIEKVDGMPTPWVSPIVTPPKKDPDEIRLCVDMREPNKAIYRERHLLPTTEELIHDLNGAKVFSKLDLRSGYHQLELDESSRYITTFNTHAGMYRYKRLNFGISSASEVFQEAIRKVIQGVEGSKNISDDIIVYGTTQEKHDKALTKTFDRLKQNSLTLNRKKCEFNKSKIEFFGLVFGADSISPDPKKVEAIKKFGQPQDVKELRSFIGMTSYLSRFIKNYSTIIEPLRRLTKQEVEWIWGTEQQSAFTRLQQELSSDCIVAYYDPKKEMKILCDASPVGLAAILEQDKIVAYASRSLSETESRYSQTEREALAIVWACEHFDIYLRGAKHFTVITDHKPLERIWSKPNPPLRIQRWGLRLQPYKFSIKYRPGEENPADYMSRHPINTIQSVEIAEEYVNFIANESVPNAMSLDEIKTETSKDKTLQLAIEFAKMGKWYKIKSVTDCEIDIEELKSISSIKDELTILSENLLLKDGKIVLPKSLRTKAIEISHEGHQGMSRTKSYLRSKVWFPNMNPMVEKAVKKCYACQLTTKEPTRLEPLKMSDLPEEAWRSLSMDFCGPLPSGEYMMVIIDEYSRYPIVEITRSVSANKVIPILDKVLSEFGFPKIIKTDNGSPFNSNDFRNYMNNCGIIHRLITPRWPRANAQAEAFNKPMMKIVRAAHATRQNWKQELYKFLRQYRATPHTATGFAPYNLLFRNEPQTKLPHISSQNRDGALKEQMQQNDTQSKFKTKEYADKRNNAQSNDIKVGDHVLLKNDFKENKLSTTFKPQPYVVSSKCGNKVTAKSEDGGKVTRNSSRFKPFDTSTIIPKTFEIPENYTIENETYSVPTNNNDTQIDTATPKIQNEQPRRSLRVKRQPSHLKDYVK